MLILLEKMMMKECNVVLVRILFNFFCILMVFYDEDCVINKDGVIEYHDPHCKHCFSHDVIKKSYNRRKIYLENGVPGVIFLFMKINAKKRFNQLQQKIQHNASQIDNYLEQRVIILQNVVGIVEKAIDLDKDVMKNVAKFRNYSDRKSVV